LKYLQK
jgi:hypothetical protein